MDQIPKSALIEGIIKKVFNLTLESFANTHNEERENMMMKIEEKLNKSAQFFGAKREKYVNLIMDGVRSMSPANMELNNDAVWTDHDNEEISDSSDGTEKHKVGTKPGENVKKSANEIKLTPHKIIKRLPELRESMIVSRTQQKVIDSTINDIKKTVQVIDQKAKSSLVKGILKKVFNITLESFVNIPYEEKEKMIKNIEKKLNKSAKFLGPKSGKYVSLIMEGIRSLTSDHNWSDSDSSNIEMNSRTQQLAISKQDLGLLKRDSIANTIKVNSKNNKARRMEFEFIDNINVNNDLNAKSTEIFKVNGRKDDSNRMDYEYKDLLNKKCQDKTADICVKIRTLKIIKCTGKGLSVKTLCDGIDDCFDYSDEQDCAVQGVSKVRNASQIMLDIEKTLSDNCYKAKIDDSLIAKQNEILRNVLQSQLKFIQKHASLTATNTWRSNLRKFYAEPENIRKTVNEVAAVILTLASALEETVCTSEFDESARKFNAIDNEAPTDVPDVIQTEVEPELPKTTSQPPSPCSCVEDDCVGKCLGDCEGICMQRYQIGRWQCKAINNQKTISLDLICDGKLDCYDEADENGCSLDFTKFEADQLYSTVIDMIMTKTKLASFEVVRNKLINLQRLIKELQKLATKRTPDVTEIKASRNICFSEMMSIYDLNRHNAVSMAPINEMHLFLMSVNEKLVNAMKHSHIGNDRIIETDGCLCRENQCALLDCSQTCVRACPAEPKLTRYFCGRSIDLNQSIPVEAICNGKVDCADKDDEEGCSKDICRRHHLILLRHKLLQAAEERMKDTILAEALKPWTTKVSATLKILESNGRPTPRSMRDVVNEMLHDLVMTYASLGSFKRRNNHTSIDQFYKTALLVMSSLKTCGK